MQLARPRLSSVVFLAFSTLVSVAPAAAAEQEWTIASVEKNAVETLAIDSRKATPDCRHAWSVHVERLHGGKQEGVDVVRLSNGKLSLVVVACRGMGIWSAECGDVRLGWNSPVGEIVHPRLVNLTSRGGLGWLDGFGEWLCRCGLENNGHPGPDTLIDNTGAEATMDLTLHGKQAYLPAQEVTLAVDRESPYRIRLRGTVHERMMHGPKLRLVTEISTVPGTSEFTISDEVHNDSANPSEFQLLYHINFGKPLLEAGAELIAPVAQVTGFNEEALRGGIEGYDKFAGPTAGFVEQVYCLRPWADAQGRTSVVLANAARDRGCSLSYAVEALPFLTLWKNTAAEADGYVVGIEPGTNYPHRRQWERAQGRVPKLAGGASRRFEIRVAVHENKADVEQAARAIAEIQQDRKTTFDAAPEADPTAAVKEVNSPTIELSESDQLHAQAVAMAQQAVEAAARRVAGDPARPAYHFQSPALWMNDPNGPLFHNGEYHLFYQHNPYGADWGHMHWGHAKSKDLAHWQHLPIALAPSLDRGEEHCFSGSAVVNNGVPTIFYTSIGPKTPAGDGAVQWSATGSDDLATWRKSPANPIMTEQLHGGDKVLDWRDPYVFRQGDRWLMTLGGRLRDRKGAAFLYESPDLAKWKYRGVLYESPSDPNWECPNFFKLKDKWVLIASPHGKVRYLVGDFDEAAGKFTPHKQGLVDFGPIYYAPNGLFDASGRHLLWGWLRDVRGDGWNGALGLPRALSIDADGDLVMQPAKELEQLRGQEQSIAAAKLTAQQPAALTIDSNTFEAEARIKNAGARRLRITLEEQGNAKNWIELGWDIGERKVFAGSETQPRREASLPDDATARVFVDKRIVEAFFDGQQCATLQFESLPKGPIVVRVAAEEGAAQLEALRAWPIAGIW